MVYCSIFNWQWVEGDWDQGSFSSSWIFFTWWSPLKCCVIFRRGVRGLKKRRWPHNGRGQTDIGNKREGRGINRGGIPAVFLERQFFECKEGGVGFGFLRSLEDHWVIVR